MSQSRETNCRKVRLRQQEEKGQYPSTARYLLCSPSVTYLDHSLIRNRHRPPSQVRFKKLKKVHRPHVRPKVTAREVPPKLEKDELHENRQSLTEWDMLAEHKCQSQSRSSGCDTALQAQYIFLLVVTETF